MTEPTITIPAPLFRALCAAAQAVCEDGEIVLSAQLVSNDLMTALRAALDPLQEVGATPAQALDRRYRSDAP